ncbi:hypothetical protein [Dyella silvatica]|uniref:hypothetical protein n=1 Tax=Dyella silvatica TaxID=2992128 RepID=UPI002251FED6|nr:hypothetical protein [Dyella silvatica]
MKEVLIDSDQCRGRVSHHLLHAMLKLIPDALHCARAGRIDAAISAGRAGCIAMTDAAAHAIHGAAILMWAEERELIAAEHDIGELIDGAAGKTVAVEHASSTSCEREVSRHLSMPAIAGAASEKKGQEYPGPCPKAC